MAKKKKAKKPQYVYLAVTVDKYELPIAVADTKKELCELLGLNYGSVINRFCHEKEPVVRLGKKDKTKIIKVKI